MPNTDFMNLKEVLGLSEKERLYLLKIMQEMSCLGLSSTLDDLRYADYNEIPVDIITFATDRHYLGNAWHTNEGKLKLFDYWKKRLRELFPDNISTSVGNAIFSGSRGIGKSEVAVLVACYLMYRIMCLKDAHSYFDLKPTEKICFAFMNITKYLAEDIGNSKFLETVKSSPWFLSHGNITGTVNKVWNPPDYIQIIIGSQSSHVIGLPIYFAFFDEISFIKNLDIERQKAIAIDMIDTAIGGMKTRFTRGGKNPTLLVLASSKRSEKSFLEEHMKRKILSEKSNVLIVDEPIWNVRPATEYSGETFRVALGNKFLAHEVIHDNKSDVQPYIDKGYQILNVPIEYRAKFIEDIDRALCDYAGVSSSSLTKYISGIRLLKCKDTTLLNPFTRDVILVGNSPDDIQQYYDYFDLSKINSDMKSKPLYIHLDMSLSGDRTGIAGVWIKGKKPPQEGVPESKELYYLLAFSVGIEAPKGWLVSFEKNRQFIYWLKEQGFKIKGISSDTYLSADLAQTLLAKKYKYTTISVDRVDGQSHTCLPYHTFRSAIYEERFSMYESNILTTEITDLERDSNGKIDHPDHGKTGSKDICDAVCGALYNASQNGEQYAFDYGEDLLVTTEVSVTVDETQKISKAFEEELMKMFDPMLRIKQQSATSNILDKTIITEVKNNGNNLNEQNKKPKYMDFGMGPAQPLAGSQYLGSGIIVW